MEKPVSHSIIHITIVRDNIIPFLKRSPYSVPDSLCSNKESVLLLLLISLSIVFSGAAPLGERLIESKFPLGSSKSQRLCSSVISSDETHLSVLLFSTEWTFWLLLIGSGDSSLVLNRFIPPKLVIMESKF